MLFMSHVTPPPDKPPQHHIAPQLPAAPSKIEKVAKVIKEHELHEVDPKALPQKRIPPETSELYKTVFEGKTIERDEVFNAFCSVTRADPSTLKKTPSATDQIDFVNVQMKRALERQELRDPQMKADELFDALSDLKKLTVENVKNCLKERGVSPAHIDLIVQDIEAGLTLYRKNSFDKEYKKLLGHLDKIQLLLQKSDVDKEGVNREILFTLRKALANPAYQLMKEQEEQPAVKVIHAYLLASYTEPKVFHAFQKIGAHLDAVTKQGLPLDEKLKSSRDAGYKHGLIKKAMSREYFANFFSHVVGAFWSTHIGKKIGSFFGQAYDPRGTLGNNAGALYNETIYVQGKPVELRCVYTPSPTVGSKVSPEARGILQAMENRQKSKPENLAKDPYPYLVWSYTNLQDIGSLDEGKRASAIMRLNEEYPLSFRGISITADSPFFRAGVHGEDETKIQQAVASDDTALDEAYAKEMLEELLHNANFTLENRTENRGGHYYFPAKDDIERAEWEKEFGNIVMLAFKAVTESKQKKPENDPTWNWSQKAAFRELVHLGIIIRQQEKAAQEVAPKEGKVLAANLCKENIDRGGKMQAMLLWALGADEKEVFCAFHARALLGRYRLVLPDRVEPMYALIRCVGQKEAHAFLNSISAQIEGQTI